MVMERIYGIPVSDVEALYALNKAEISNPDLIYVGQRFVLA